MQIDDLKREFIRYFAGSGVGLRVFSSPGRINLIGEHTDYNGGYVLPAALTLSSTVIARPREDRRINLIATDLKTVVEASLDNLEQYRSLKWGNYQLGVADELQKAGYKLVGCDILFHDTVPLGSGLSSSAAIEVVTALALVTLGNEANGMSKAINMLDLAKISQVAEHNFIGVKCGIMDQFASAMGKENHAVFLNCKDLSFQHIPLDLDGYKIVIGNTKVKRSLAGVKYNERREECNTGLEILKTAIPEATCLGDVSLEQFFESRHLIQDEIIRKRLEHVVAENDRVLRSVEALKNNHILEFGQLMIASHNSLRYLYEVTGVELDTMVEEALKVDGVIGSRMTGAGFGGCTLSIVKEAAVDRFIAQVGKNYEERIHLKPEFYVSRIGNGGREIKA